MSQFVALPVILGVAALTAAADQAAKSYVLGSQRLRPRERRPALVGIRATLNENSVLARMSQPEAVVISTLANIAAVAAGLLLGGIGAFGAGLAVGGMAGNLIDQQRRHAIVDILALRNGSVVNLADIAIAAGTILMIVALLL